MPEISLIGLYDELMSVHHRAFAGARYNVAYHALAAALHCAEDACDLERVTEVEHLASEQLVWIDLHAPAYEHSSQNASSRGHASIYTMLSRQAHAKALMLQRRHNSSPHPTS